jgi:lysyl-tRNA synthetase class 1
MLKRFVGTRTISVSDIPFYMNEFDELEDVYFGQKPVAERDSAKLKGLYEYCWVMNPPTKPKTHVPYNLLAFLAKMAPKDCLNEFLSEKLQSYRYLQRNQQVDDDLARRIEYVVNWVQDFEEIKETSINLTENEKAAFTKLIKVLESVDESDEVQNAIFNVAKTNGLKPRAFFRTLYLILLGAPQGPRMGPYILAMGKQNVTAALRRALNKK